LQAEQAGVYTSPEFYQVQLAKLDEAAPVARLVFALKTLST
jgi:hypothetical protein